jgi:uncharacterized repeat protein (TIGR03837 family)
LKPVQWDIFCSVVDNYGDIGVAWRLARQLAAEHGLRIRLWVDDLRAFGALWPTILPGLDSQDDAGVEVRAWHEPFVWTQPAPVVIDAFGCKLPDVYLAAMAEQSVPPVWINLEYLSAEAWVRSYHGLPSPHPRLPLTRYFFFPGYEPGSGGLLCERTLSAHREQFLRNDSVACRQALATVPDALYVSLFAYENAALPALLSTWADGAQPVVCVVPQGRVVAGIAAWLGVSAMREGLRVTRGNLHLRIVPFMMQDDYDRLLWACDVNFVRGEDSCVRAQWARVPFVWQAYPQAQNAHRAKLDALLTLYLQDLPTDAADAVRGLWLCWNAQSDCDAGQAWTAFMALRARLKPHAQRWAGRIAAHGDLAQNLVNLTSHKTPA